MVQVLVCLLLWQLGMWHRVVVEPRAPAAHVLIAAMHGMCTLCAVVLRQRAGCSVM